MFLNIRNASPSPNSKSLRSKQSSNKSKLQFRYHYKNNFKNVDQIALEAQNNIQAIQNLPTQQTDFGLKEHYYFDNFENEDDSSLEKENRDGEGFSSHQQIDYSNLNQDKVSTTQPQLPPAPNFAMGSSKKYEKLLQDNFQQVIDQTDQEFDECYAKFEKNVNAVMYGITSLKTMTNLQTTKTREGSRPQTNQQSRNKREMNNLERTQTYNTESANNRNSSCKRPVTAVTYSNKFGKQARSLSPVHNENPEKEQSQIKQKWDGFLKETDKNLKQYEKVYVDNTYLKKPPLGSYATQQTAVGQETNTQFSKTQSTNWYQTQPSGWNKTFTNNRNISSANNKVSEKQGFVRSLSSRSSLQTQQKIHSQNDFVELQKLSNLLKKEIELGFTDLNLKQPFLTGKIMESLETSDNFEQKDLIKDLNLVTQNYMYVFEDQILSKLANVIFINSATKKYLYREICELLYDKLDSSLQEIKQNRNSRENEIQQLKKDIKNNEKQFTGQKEELNKKYEMSKEQHLKELGEVNEKNEKLRNENILLTENVRQLKRDLIQQESDMKFYQIQSKNEFENKFKTLLEKFHSLEETSTKNDQHYSGQYDCMSELVNNYHSAVVKLRLSKETISQQSLKIEQLLNELSRLNVRASTQFYDLTPRPSFTELEDICKSLTEPENEGEDDKIKDKIPVLKFSDLDSVKRIKKITHIIKTGIKDYQNLILRLNSKKVENSAITKGKKSSSKASKPLLESTRLSFKQSKGSNNSSLQKADDTKKKRQPKKSKFEQGIQKIVNKIQPASKDLNISDNLSLNSDEKLALQKQSIDEYEDSLNDF